MIHANETKDLFSSLDLYYDALSSLGYIKYPTVDKLLVFSFISELLEGKYADTLSEEDRKTISKALEGIYGSACLLPYSKHEQVPCLSKKPVPYFVVN